MDGSSSPDRVKILVTCEHGGAELPQEYAHLFSGTRNILRTHLGYDLGALALARRLARHLRSPLMVSKTSRLLVDLNRSPGHPSLFSAWTRTLPGSARARLLSVYHHPYRTAAIDKASAWIAEGFLVLHLSVHTFTPVLHQKVRRLDVGVLCDPARTREVAFCKAWKKAMHGTCSGLVVGRNRPYRGDSDGLTASLRNRFEEGRYLGIELEVNQRHHRVRGDRLAQHIENCVIRSFQQAVDDFRRALQERRWLDGQIP
jgi:predicted N-formylglutamate amidohydrolase